MGNNAFGMHALTDLSKQLKTVDRKFANAIRANLRSGVKAAGAGVLNGVKAGASWSSRIPAATKLTVRYSTKGASIRIIVDHNKAPHARPLEVGNKNNFTQAVAANGGYKIVNGRRVAVHRSVYKKALKSGVGVGRELRHPVFHKVGAPGGFADMPTRPFFFPAVKAAGASIDVAMEKVIIQTARDAGFK